MLVETIKKGETTFYFHDDYCKNTTPEEVEGILNNIARIAYPALRAKYMREVQKDETA